MAPTFLIGTIIYAAIGAVATGSCNFWAGKHTSLARLCAITAAFCMWLSWATVYMSQMYPLVLPERNLNTHS
ncbi:V-type H+-transporting ATPase subunit H [Diplonema papillatum]|nr:V-type H+-transporting ATPase subunit H [Diplonema papillatum]